MTSLWDMLKQTVADFLDDGAPELGAALAFYSILSLAPLLMIAVAIAGYLFGEEAAQGELNSQIQELVGKEGAEAVQQLLAHARKPGTGIFATVLGVATLLFGASGVFGQLQSSLNRIWEVEPRPQGGIWGFVQQRFLSFAMVLGVGFLLLVSLIISAILSGLGSYLGTFFPGWNAVLSISNAVVSFALVSLLFAMIFKVLPDVQIAWKDVAAGAVLTALLFGIGKFAIGKYLGYAAIGSSYGAAGSLVVLVIWIYYSAQILFLGAEFTQVYASTRGTPIIPAANAVRKSRVKGNLGSPRSETPTRAPDRIF